jgi:hypothetical protein
MTSANTGNPAPDQAAISEFEAVRVPADPLRRKRRLS